MRDSDEAGDFEASTRRAYDRLLGDILPAAGRAQGWPWTTRAEFEALLHGHLGLDAASTPDDPGTLGRILAVDLGQRLLSGDVCWTRLRACEIARCEAAPPAKHASQGGR